MSNLEAKRKSFCLCLPSSPNSGVGPGPPGLTTWAPPFLGVGAVVQDGGLAQRCPLVRADKGIRFSFSGRPRAGVGVRQGGEMGEKCSVLASFMSPPSDLGDLVGELLRGYLKQRWRYSEKPKNNDNIINRISNICIIPASVCKSKYLIYTIHMPMSCRHLRHANM